MNAQKTSSEIAVNVCDCLVIFASDYQQCWSDTCENGGTCQMIFDGSAHNCICPEGYVGSNCNETMLNCEIKFCSGNCPVGSLTSLGCMLLTNDINDGSKYYKVSMGNSNSQDACQQLMKSFNGSYSYYSKPIYYRSKLAQRSVVTTATFPPTIISTPQLTQDRAATAARRIVARSVVDQRELWATVVTTRATPLQPVMSSTSHSLVI